MNEQFVDLKYHARNNPGATKRDQFRPCQICGWSKGMAIHDEANIGAITGWAHRYEPSQAKEGA